MDIEKLLEATKGAGKDNPEQKEYERARKREYARMRRQMKKAFPSQIKRAEEAAKRKEEQLKIKAEKERKERRRKIERAYRMRHYDPVKAREYRKKHPKKLDPNMKYYTVELPKDVLKELDKFCSKHKLLKKTVMLEALKKYMSEYGK